MLGSGSDAASLKTTARREGDNYVLNGSKVGITLAVACTSVEKFMVIFTCKINNDGKVDCRYMKYMQIV